LHIVGVNSYTTTIHVIICECLAVVDDTFVKIFVFFLSLSEFFCILQLEGLLLVDDGVHDVSILLLQLHNDVFVLFLHHTLLLFQCLDFLFE